MDWEIGYPLAANDEPDKSQNKEHIMDANHHSAARAAGGHSSISEHLERRLSEAWQGLWDNFVDPREALWDDGPD